MSFLSLLAIALGLSMDAFAVAVTSGVCIKDLQLRHALRIGACFGFFQAGMPLLGWAGGIQFREYITRIDHWIAFGLLGFIGLKMIYETWRHDGEVYVNPMNSRVLLVLAVATSIDALAVGISFAFLEIAILPAVVVIGLVTFGLATCGVFVGKLGGEMLKSYAGIAGGFILTLMGAKILFEHLDIQLELMLNVFR